MNTAVAIQQEANVPFAGFDYPARETEVNTLLSQLDHYRRQSAWLAMVNKLHARLARATDLGGMLEAYSVWLMPRVEHDLLAFRSADGSREHIICSSHGPVRRKIIRAAKVMLNREPADAAAPCLKMGDFFGCRWQLDLPAESGVLMVMRRGGGIDEPGVDLLARTMEILAEPLQRALEYETLFEQARRDSLTGLANRRVFDERIEAIMEASRRYGHSLTLLSMDLDCFKQLNDSQGHAEGDRALVRIAATLSSMVRTSDLLVRMGGDEFLLVLPDSDAEAAKKLAERIQQAVKGLGFGAEERHQLGISIGIAPWRRQTLQEWLHLADEALYEAKSADSSWVCFDNGDI
ncbi:diguanylate cyclase domain-containing protein [Desulfurivibrio sp. D14AmB]|uniref:GGDEF domain-containing protein n=1 Tax=Desulfurivibrio sp. D14AmB TaxID=3374370 RepID=UPI00376EB8D2